MTRPRIAVISRTAAIRDQFARELSEPAQVDVYADPDDAMDGLRFTPDVAVIICHAQGLPPGTTGTPVWTFRQWVERRFPGLPFLWLRRKGQRRLAGGTRTVIVPIGEGLLWPTFSDLVGPPPLASAPVAVAVDLRIYTASFAGQSVHLTRLEAQALAYLQRHTGRIISPDELLTRVWQYQYPAGSDTLIRAHVSNLRKKLASIGVDGHDAIQTVRGHGYRWPEADSAERRAA